MNISQLLFACICTLSVLPAHPTSKRQVRTSGPAISVRDVKLLLYHEWELKIGPKRLPRGDESFLSFEFSTNGDIIITTSKPEKGTWKYDEKSNILTITSKSKIEHLYVLEINEKILLLKNADEESSANIRLMRRD